VTAPLFPRLLRRAGAIARRLAWAVVVLFGVATLSFMVAQVLPGDPARMILGPQASPADVTRARALYGFDRPVWVRYVLYWKRLVHRAPPAPASPAPAKEHRSCAAVGLGLHLDLGYSFYYRKPVVDLLAARIPRSAELALAAFLVQIALGVGLGAMAASRRGTAWDDASMGATLLGLSMPTFLLGLGLQYVFAYKLGWLPFDGYGATAAEHVRSIVLPALTLGLFGSALYARLTRDEIGAILAQDYIRTARAKGASEARVLWVHALRNALVPLGTLAALDFGTLLGGAVVTEQLFRWPGVGRLAVDAALNHDGPVLFGTVLFTGAAVVASLVALDLIYDRLDPRLRAGRR
jgi:peptide/nickel transport system permease protein